MKRGGKKKIWSFVLIIIILMMSLSLDTNSTSTDTNSTEEGATMSGGEDLFEDFWKVEGLRPYGQYFQDLNEYVSPMSGQVYIKQADLVLQGRGIDLKIERFFDSSDLGFYESVGPIRFSDGWEFNFPKVGTVDVNGEEYKQFNLGDGTVYRKKTAYPSLPDYHEGIHFQYDFYPDPVVTLKDGTKYSFINDHLISEIQDKNGNTITFHWDNFKIDHITDTAGRTVQLNYEEENPYTISSIVCGDKVVQYGYSTWGGDTSLNYVIDPEGRQTNYRYTVLSDGWVTKRVLDGVTYPSGGYSKYEYHLYQFDYYHPIKFPNGDNPRHKKAFVSKQSFYTSQGVLDRYKTFGYTFIESSRDYPKPIVEETVVREYDGDGTLKRTTTLKYGGKYGQYSQTQQRVCVEKKVGNRTITYHYDFQLNLIRETTTLSGTTIQKLYERDDWGNITKVTDEEENEQHFYYVNTNSEVPVPDNSNVNEDIHNLCEKSVIDNEPSDMIAHFIYDDNGNLLQSKKKHDGSWLTSSNSFDQYGNVIQSTDENNNITYYTYDSSTHFAYPTKLKRDGVEINLTYDQYGNPTSQTDGRGYTYQYYYDLLDRMTKMINPDLTEREAVYDDTNSIVTIYDENDTYIKQHYDGLGKLILGETFENGTPYSSISYEYGYGDEVKKVTDELSHTTTYEYDIFGRTTKITHHDGTSMRYTYDNPNNKITVTDENNHKKVYHYDWVGNLKEVREYIDGSTYYTTQYTYDNVGNLIKIEDEPGNVKTFEYDDLGRLTRVTYPDTTYEEFGYDNAGNMTWKKNQNGDTVQYSYDSFNRLTQITYPDSSVTSYQYDNNGNVHRSETGNCIEQFIYDNRNRVTSATKTIDGTTYPLDYTYDNVSNLTSLGYPDLFSLYYTYDQLNRTIGIGYGTTTYASFGYNKVSRATDITYGNGVTTSFAYDNRNRITNIAIDSHLNLNYTYDAVGNIITLNDVTYQYDELDRLTNTTEMNTYDEYSYDPLGNRIERFDKMGESPPQNWMDTSWIRRKPITLKSNNPGILSNFQVKLTVTYDSDMQSDFDDLRFTSSDGTTQLIYWIESYTEYSSAIVWVKIPIISFFPTTIYMYYGNVATTSTSDGSAVFEFFDDAETGIPSDKWSIYANLDVSYVTEEAHSGSKSMKVTGPEDLSTWEKIQAYFTGYLHGIVVSFYIKQSTTTDRTFPCLQSGGESGEARKATTRWDSDGDLEYYTGSYHDTGYDYSTTWEHHEFIARNGVIEWKLDGVTIADNITQECWTSINIFIITHKLDTTMPTYYLDDVIIRKTVRDGCEPTVTFGEEEGWGERVIYMYNTMNELTSDGTWAYTYDSNGNLISKTDGTDTFTYTYDYDNMLTEVKMNGETIAQYFYDAKGQRYKKIENDETIVYVWSGNNIAYEKNVTTNVETKYLYANVFLIAKIVKDGVNEITTYYHQDHLLSTRLLTDVSGNVIEEEDYEEFGSDENDIAERYKFTGKEQDATGLYYFGARYYDPTIGRFITRDPIKGDIMNPQTLNPYVYCLNNPLKYIDPNGEWHIGAHDLLPDGDVVPDDDRLKEYMNAIESGDHNFDEETERKIREWSLEAHYEVIEFESDRLNPDFPIDEYELLMNLPDYRLDPGKILSGQPGETLPLRFLLHELTGDNQAVDFSLYGSGVAASAAGGLISSCPPLWIIPAAAEGLRWYYRGVDWLFGGDE